MTQTTQDLRKEYGRTHKLHQKSNLRIMSIEEREEVQAKGIHNIFNKIITEVSES
jgi:hypothetical protein